MGSLSNSGFSFLKKEEGCKLKCYNLGDDGWTVGYGHFFGKGKNPPKMQYTQAEVEAFFKSDKKWCEGNVNKYFKSGMTQSMFDAMFSLAYNSGNVHEPLRSAIQKDPFNKQAITQAFINTRSGGKFSKQLKARRKREADLYFSGGGGNGTYNPEGDLEEGGAANNSGEDEGWNDSNISEGGNLASTTSPTNNSAILPKNSDGTQQKSVPKIWEEFGKTIELAELSISAGEGEKVLNGELNGNQNT